MNNSDQRKQKRVYVDMVGDLWHYGHAEFCRRALQFGNYLIVGLMGDDDAEQYKRRPFLTIDERAQSALACRYVSEVLKNVPCPVTYDFIQKYEIDIVVHGDDIDDKGGGESYSVPIALGIYRSVPYSQHISTTKIIERIKARAVNIS